MSLEIAGRAIGAGERTFVIAELSANHLGSIDRAKAVIKAARDAGADAVKLQTYRADTITLNVHGGDFYIKDGPWGGRDLYDLYSEAYTPWEWHEELFRYAEGLGLICFSSPFDLTAVDFLSGLGAPAYKIASFEVNDIPLIRKCAETGRPVIISTGAADMGDIELALEICREAGAPAMLLKCVSEYPARYEDMNIRTIPTIAASFGVPVGLSDHSLGSAVAVASIALGACAVEKHLTVSRGDGGPDCFFSMEPDEFASMVTDIRRAEAALGDPTYRFTEDMRRAREGSRSLYAAADIAAGELFTVDNVKSVRPGHGMHTRHYGELLGMRARVDIKMGTAMSWALVDFGSAKR